MKSIYIKLCFLPVLVILGAFIAVNSASAETQVGGELKHHTTWTKTGSPYTLIRTVIIPRNYSLTIEPGVEIYMEAGSDMFEVIGDLTAIGTEEEPIIFDGWGNSIFFDTKRSINITDIELEHVVLKNGLSIWDYGFGNFNLRNSTLENIMKRSYFYYPAQDTYIEKNTFTDFAGFSIGVSNDAKVVIQNNIFDGKIVSEDGLDDYIINCWSSFNQDNLVVKYNTFRNIEGNILELESGNNGAQIIASENYWEDMSTDDIEAAIIDANDGYGIANTIIYEPVLTRPHLNTPGTLVVEAPGIDLVSAETEDSSYNLVGTKTTDVSIWINDEEVVVSTSTDWTAEVSLEIGENIFNISAKDGLDNESERVVVTITRLESDDVPVCHSFTYSEWGNCMNGQEQRSVLSVGPEGCQGGQSEELVRVCSAEVEEPTESIVTREKGLMSTIDSELTEKLAGRILLQVEEKGEAWYISPVDMKKYYLGRPIDAFQVMRELGLGARNEFIKGHEFYPNHVLGRILIDVDDSGKAYYINPLDKKAYYLGRPIDAFQVMRELGLGITNENLRKIGIGEL